MGNFDARHIGPDDSQIESMLESLGSDSLKSFIASVVPRAIYADKELFQIAKSQPAGQSEQEVLQWFEDVSKKNTVLKPYAGQGYYGTVTPSVIERTVFTNPSWYTQYTPYQAEIAQGRLEALLNYQTLVCELTGLPIANASLLDEATAAGEALSLMAAKASESKNVCLIDIELHPQTRALLKARAHLLGIVLRETSPRGSALHEALQENIFGLITQNPGTSGVVRDLTPHIERVHVKNALVAVATDLLSCCLLTPPGSMGADIVFGSAQRFGVPIGFGGPHAAFFAVREELKRSIPGRLIGVSKDAQGNPALRLALQTREQHIRREKATSNICTAQVLLAIMASMYAVYHGPSGLRRIAEKVHRLALQFATALKSFGITPTEDVFFDTVQLKVADALSLQKDLIARGILIRVVDEKTISVAFDETSCDKDSFIILSAINSAASKHLVALQPVEFDPILARAGRYLTQPVFNSHHTETKLLRYIKQLENKDLSLAHSMIPLGSCTMKLNSAIEMKPISLDGFAKPHPLAPVEHTKGYEQLFEELSYWLADITGFDAVSLQPNSGAQGEYAGLFAIRQFLMDNGKGERTVCLIPTSAHGTNPASAVIAGFTVVQISCDELGNINVADLRAKIELHTGHVGALMLTYPSTHGVFEETIREITELVHHEGGLVYMDGANLNALVGLVRPADLGADVCHINLHKTFCIPHGGGGPGMGPIACREILKNYLPNHPFRPIEHSKSIGPVAAAPYGSASILPISLAYMKLMGFSGLRRASTVAILNANYVAAKLESYYPVLYRGANNRVAHECILDLRAIEKNTGIKVEDVAKRLMDYGFHAPTVSWPVAGTLMVEPTESEAQDELDRFIDAMIQIRHEITAIENGSADRMQNPLKNAPHTAAVVCNDVWPYPYSRETAAFPLPWVHQRKFWPAVARVDGVYGDKNLICTCSW